MLNTPKEKKKLLELINELSKVAGHKVRTQRTTTQVRFYTLTMSNMQGKDLYTGNSKTLLKELKKIQINGRKTCS